jgi:hypothetical protein
MHDRVPEQKDAASTAPSTHALGQYSGHSSLRDVDSPNGISLLCHLPTSNRFAAHLVFSYLPNSLLLPHSDRTSTCDWPTTTSPN